MNESLLIRFASQGRPLNVIDFQAREGVTFDHHPDASPLNLALGFQSLLPGQLDLVRRRHDWRNQEFLLDVAADSGALRVSGFEGDAEGLPPGAYDITIELESYKFRDDLRRVVVHEGQATEIALEEDPDLRRVQLRDNIDGLTSTVIGHPRSAVDGLPLSDWLASPNPRAARKACLLNILCKLRTPPDPAGGFSDPLTSLMEFVFFADVDRAYAAFRPGLRQQLDRFVDAGMWVREGHPGAPIHQRLRAGMTRIGVPNAGEFDLTSYRQGGRNCLQIVVATPPAGSADPTSYADVDIDLGNPLWDVVGFIVHASELLDSGRTDHLALRSKLAKGPTSDFMYYDLVQAQETTA
jgi:hypothetical protein